MTWKQKKKRLRWYKLAAITPKQTITWRCVFVWELRNFKRAHVSYQPACNRLLSHTCGIYYMYPCDKPLLYQTVDALSSTPGPNCFLHSPSIQRFSDLFWGFFCIFHITFSTTKKWYKMDFVEDLHNKYTDKHVHV